VPITVESTVFHASYVHGKTDRRGRYRIDVPSGGWKVHAQLTRTYHGVGYLFDLAPDDPEPFAGTRGATRNFTWRIEGPRAELAGGHHGAQLTLYRGSHDVWFELHDVEVRLVPDGPLVDGRPGRPLTLRPAEGADQLDDIPIGRYAIAATHATHGPMLVRVRNRGGYAATTSATFGPAYPGSTRYALELEVRVPSR
jgi:hypothetical protein